MTTDCSCSIQKKSSTVCQHTSDVCSYGDAYENARTEKKDMPLKKTAIRQTSRNRFMLARVNGVYSNPPVLQNISGGKTAVPADVSQLTCATAASDGERRKVLPCFSRAGHRPKVGHKSFAHAHNLLKKTLHVCESCADCLLEKASEKTKRYLRKKKNQFNTSVLDSKHRSVRGKKITTSSGKNKNPAVHFAI